MGKSKKKRHRNRASNVLVADASSLDEANGQKPDESQASANHFIEELLSSITNAEYEETIESSLAALANLAMGIDGAKAMVECGVVRQLGPLLLHSNVGVKEIVAGTLRNISVSGGVDVCSSMVQQDIMTCLSASIKQNVDVALAEEDGGEISKRDKWQHFLTQIVSLTWNLCESSATAIKVFNDENLVSLLLRVAKAPRCSQELMTACAHCLYAATEDNQPALVFLSKDSEFLCSLATILKTHPSQADNVVLQAAVAGITFNLLSVVDEHARSACLVLLLDWAAGLLAIDSNCVAASVVQVQKMRDVLNAQQICLEMLSNMLCSEDDDDWQDFEGSMDDDADETGAVCQEDTMSVASVALVDELRKREIPALVLQRCAVATPRNASLIVNPDERVSYEARASRVQARALLCINNLLSLPCLEACFSKHETDALWVTFVGLLRRDADGRICRYDDEFLEAISAAMRSVAMAMAKVNSTDFVNQDTLLLLNDMMTSIGVESAQINLIGLLGAIGKLVSQRENSVDQLKAIGTILQTTLLSASTSLLLAAEVLDAVFETFADGVDGSVDNALASLDLMATLKAVSVNLKSKIRAERRSLGADVAIVDNARINLVRFIKYKEKP